MNVTTVLTRDYKENHPSSHPENKPNSNPIQSQTNPIGSDAQNESNLLFNKGLRRKTAFQPPQKQTQFKPNQTQFAGDAQMNVTSVLTNHYENSCPRYQRLCGRLAHSYCICYNYVFLDHFELLEVLIYKRICNGHCYLSEYLRGNDDRCDLRKVV